MFAKRVAVQGLGANRSGKGLRFEGLLRLVVCGHFNRFLRSRDQHLEQEVGHHQLLPDVVEALRFFVVLKAPGGLDGLLRGDAVAVEIVKSGNHGGFKVRVLEMEKITQGIA